MKKIFLLSAATILCFFVITSGLLSQSPFKAKAALPAALTQAKKDLKDPELFFLGTKVGSFTTPIGDISNDFDFTKGTATVWAYMYRSISKPDSIKLYGAINLFSNYTVQSIDVSQLTGQLPFQPTDALGTQTWVDSDIMAQDIKNNTDYKAYLIKNSDAKLNIAGLGVDPTSQTICWLVMINSDKASTNLNCIVNVASGETVCLEATPVIEPITSEFMIYPNPVTTNAVISLPSVPVNNFRIDLYNIMGEKLSTINSDGNQNATQFILDVNNFPDGLYYISYSSNGKNIVKPMIIKK